jgi:hypothetical protein
LSSTENPQDTIALRSGYPTIPERVVAIRHFISIVRRQTLTGLLDLHQAIAE